MIITKYALYDEQCLLYLHIHRFFVNNIIKKSARLRQTRECGIKNKQKGLS